MVNIMKKIYFLSSSIAVLLLLSDISALARKEPSDEMMPCFCAPHCLMSISAIYMNKLIYSFLQWHSAASNRNYT